MKLQQFAALSLCGFIAACSQDSRPPTPVITDSDYNDHWEFFHSDKVLELANAQQQREWEQIQLPHTPAGEPQSAPEQSRNEQPQGDAWYKKTIHTNSAWQGKQITLKFEATMDAAEVWFNGKKLTTHLGGYLPFSTNLTDNIKWDATNELLVRLANRNNSNTGVYRHVMLQIDNDLHISDAVAAGKTASGGIFVRYPSVSREQASISIQTHLVNSHIDPKQFRVVQRLMDGDTVVVDHTGPLQTINGRSDGENTIELLLNHPKLWSPQAPNLYQLVTRVYDGDSLADEQATRIGIRQFTWAGNQLLINGEKFLLRGVDHHPGYPYIGYAASAAADYRDAVKIKSAGFDYVRLSHHPHSPAFIAAADELGLLLLDSIPGGQYFSEDPASQAQIQQACRDLIRRDRNHAAVLAWQCSVNDPRISESFIDSLTGIVQEEYPGSLAAGWQERGYDLYLQADSNNPPPQMFNYRRDATPAEVNAGVMSIDRLPNDSYYFYQSQRDANEISTQFASGPMVFIANEWTGQSPTDVDIFSNAEAVELFLNGKLIGRQTANDRINATATQPPRHPPFSFALEEFAAGELKALAYSAGKVVAEHKVVTPAAPVRLKVTLDTSGKAPQTGVKDAVFVYAQLVDAKNNPVPADHIAVTFSLAGEGKLLGPATVNTYGGYASTLIEIGASLANLKINAEAAGVDSGSLWLDSNH